MFAIKITTDDGSRHFITLLNEYEYSGSNQLKFHSRSEAESYKNNYKSMFPDSDPEVVEVGE